jgi:hypothetical protein
VSTAEFAGANSRILVKQLRGHQADLSKAIRQMVDNKPLRNRMRRLPDE